MRIDPWGEGDLPLLEKLMGDPAMTEHLGGPESPEKIAERQARYERAGSATTGASICPPRRRTDELSRASRSYFRETGHGGLDEKSGRS